MSTIRWNPDFCTGLALVDEQHQRLVELIGAFAAALEEEPELDAAALAPILAGLLEYARQHFHTEDELFAEVAIDARHALQHRREHDDFERHVRELVARPADPPGDAARQLLDYLAHWLTYHILGCDQMMARQVRAIRDGASPAEAFAHAERSVDHATAALLRSVDGLFELLSVRNRQLTELTATLERRVAGRTEELSAANEALRSLVERVERMAMTDILTDLPNRRYALQRLEQAWDLAVRHGSPLSCLLIDADGFKQVNDTLGHEAGDEVLRMLAAELRDAVRLCDEVCRIGGDEFLVIAPETPLAGALALGERIRASVAQLRVRAGAGTWAGSVSVGVAAHGPAFADVESLLRAADRGVYAAKRAGRNAVRVDDAHEPAAAGGGARWLAATAAR